MQQIKKYRSIHIGILSFLLFACVFFTFYDILYEKIWWTVFTIYIPCSTLFLFGIKAWKDWSVKRLGYFSIILGFIDVALVGYAIALFLQSELLWSGVTLGFAILLIIMTWSVFTLRKKIDVYKKISHSDLN